MPTVIGTGGTFLDSSGGLPVGGFAGATGVSGNLAGSFGGAAAGAGISLGGITALAGLGSSVAGAIASYRAGKAARKFAKKQAAQQLKIGRMNASVVAINRRKLIGAQRAAFAASGVVANAGSPIDVMIDNFILGIVDESRALSDASYRAFNIQAGGELAFEAGARGAVSQLGQGVSQGFESGLFSIGRSLNNRSTGDTLSPLGG